MVTVQTSEEELSDLKGIIMDPETDADEFREAVARLRQIEAAG